MEYLLTYLIVAISIGFLTLSYKFNKPGLNLVSGILFFIVGLSMIYTNFNIVSGQIVTANSSITNITTYNFTDTYTSITNTTGIKWNYWSFIFLFIGLYLIIEGVLRLINKPQMDL